MNSDIEYFKARGEKLKSQISEAEDKNRRLSSLRLVFFILAATAVGIGIAKADIRIVMIILALILAAVFIALCVKHGKSKALYSHLVLIGEINERYIARINGDYSKLDPSMPDIDIKGHDYAFDLDVFGDVSLYRLYNI